MTSPPDTRIDDLRQQLKSLGYLDAGVDRFVLGGAAGARGPLAAAARASGRVGVLGGAMLGPAAALGLGARLPGLVSGPRDAVFLALYLALFFAAAVALACFTVSGVSAAFAGRPDERFAARARRVSAAAAWITAIGSLLYLTLWWRNANAGFGWSAPAWTTFALLVAVAISLLLGHGVRIATLAVLAAQSHGAPLPPVSTRSWRAVAAGAAVAFAGASILLLAAVQSDADTAASPPALAVVGSRAPIRVIALDGFDPATYERLRDRLPHLRSAFSGRQARLAPQDTRDPARAWTTIATGVPPESHGVHAMETRRVAGLSGAFTSGGRLQVIGAATDALRLTRPALATAQDRKVKTVWEVAEQAGLRTAVVNWWATWPATQADGLMLTDRAVVRLEHGGPLDAEVAPPALYDQLRAAWPQLRERAAARAAAAFATETDPAVASTLTRSAELDATLVELLRALPGPARDLDVLYLPGLDIAQNTLLGTSTASASSMASRVAALERYYVFLDQTIAPLVEDGDRTLVLLVTQPGRVQSAAGGLLTVWPRGAADADTRAANDAQARTPSAVDVAPTILYALGLPLSRELAGTALTEIFDGATPPANRFVATYGRPSSEPVRNAGHPLDQETIDRLRSLGYIK
jgi:hypothetical protein